MNTLASKPSSHQIITVPFAFKRMTADRAAAEARSAALVLMDRFDSRHLGGVSARVFIKPSTTIKRGPYET